MRRHRNARIAAPSTRLARRVCRIALGVACVSCATMVFASAPTLAATAISHPYLSSFDGSETPQGGFTSSGNLEGPSAIAVDQLTGKVYVTDCIHPNNGGPLVDVFNASGGFLSQFDNSDTEGGIASFPCARAAVDRSAGPSAGNIYITGQLATGSNGVRSSLFARYVEVFDSAGAFVTRLNGSDTPAGSFGYIADLEVASNGHLFVLDLGDEPGSGFDPAGVRIHELDASGSYLGSIASPHLGGGSGELAIDGSGNLYIGNSGQNVVKLSPAGAFLAEIDADLPTGVAIDPSTDHVYVDHGEIKGAGAYVTEYDSTGSQLGHFGSGKISGIVGIIPQSEALAVNGSTGKVYVADRFKSQIHVFGPPVTVTVPDVAVESATSVSEFRASLNGTVNPQGVPTSVHFEYKRPGVSAWQATPAQDVGSGTSDVTVSADVSGLTNGTEYEARLVASNTAADALSISGLENFTTDAVPLPSAAAGPASEVTVDSAHVSGSVDPNGFDTSWRFEYSTNGTSWSGLPESPIACEEIPAGDPACKGPVAVEANLAGLTPNQGYLVRVRATNAGGSAISNQQAFTTDPTPPSEVETVPSGVPTTTTVRLGGFANPQNSQTTYYFEYGTDETYGASFPASQDAVVGSDMTRHLLTQELTGLQPDTTYHYRIVAKNSAGTTQGQDVRFTTASLDPPPVPGRGIELVTPPDKGNQVPIVFTGGYFDADHFVWTTLTGVPGSSSGAGGAFVATRGPQGWTSSTLLPPQGQLLGAFYVPIASPTFTSSLFGVQTTNSNDERMRLVRVSPDGTQSVLRTTADTVFTPLTDVTDDLSKVFILSPEQIAPGHVAGTSNVYEIGSGTEEPISLMPGGSPPSCGVPDGGRAGSDGGFAAYSGERWAQSWISEDGSRVFFESSGDGPCSNPVELYVRNLEIGETTLISGPPLSGPGRGATFIRASADGSQAVFVSATKLDPDDANEHNDVYLYSEDSAVECLTCVVPDANVRLPSFAQTDSVVVSSDLSYVYFLSSAQLVAGEGTGLYVLHDGEIDHVAPVAGNNNNGSGELDVTRSTVSADGRYLLFASGATGVTADPTNGTEQFYRYDAVERVLRCVTCPPAGVPPAAPIANQRWAEMSADGQIVAIESATAYVPSDVNNARDLYEWRAGQIRLLTDGVNEGPQLGLEGVSSDGRSIFFRSVQTITGYERDQLYQIYVARIGGGFPPPPQPPAPCVEDACQGPLEAAPNLHSPGSAAFSGPASTPVEKQKRQRKRHGKKRRHGAKKHRGGGGQKAHGKRPTGRRGAR